METDDGSSSGSDPHSNQESWEYLNDESDYSWDDSSSAESSAAGDSVEVPIVMFPSATNRFQPLADSDDSSSASTDSSVTTVYDEFSVSTASIPRPTLRPQSRVELDDDSTVSDSSSCSDSSVSNSSSSSNDTTLSEDEVAYTPTGNAHWDPGTDTSTASPHDDRNDPSSWDFYPGPTSTQVPHGFLHPGAVPANVYAIPLDDFEDSIPPPEEDPPQMASDTAFPAFIDPLRARSAINPKETFEVIWDTGCSWSITFCEEDFVGPIKPVGFMKRLAGLARGLNINGTGQVAWCFQDIYGNFRTILVPAYLVKKSPVRLLATKPLMDKYDPEDIVMSRQQLKLTGAEHLDPRRTPISVVYSKHNNLPISICHRPPAVKQAHAALNATVSTVHKSNTNLTEPEKELLRWHNRFGHLAFDKIKFLLGLGILATAAKKGLHHTASKIRPNPKCAACQFGKQAARPTPGRTTNIVKDRQGVIDAEQLLPGQRVSVDHFICSTRGRTFESRGRGSQHSMYLGGCIFVDSASNFVDVQLQTHLNTHSTLKAKQAFEEMCAGHGVIPQTYLSDNGTPFTSRAFTEELQKFSQIIRFAGVGAHHHNSKAERAIRTIMSIARTMMLHAAIHWPDTADPVLWPMAVKHAVFLFNHVPDPKTGLSPHDVFAKTRWPQNKLHDLHVFGCPAYVLDKHIQDGKSIPRWKPRSTRRVYVGVSAAHASTVGLCLNLESGAISPQYHVVYDDEFATVSSTNETLDELTSPVWMDLFGDTPYQDVLDDDEEPGAQDTDPAQEATLTHRDTIASAMQPHAVPLPVPAPVTPSVSQNVDTPSQHSSQQPLLATPTPMREHTSMREQRPMREPISSPPPLPISSPREHPQREKTGSTSAVTSRNQGSLVSDLHHAPPLPPRRPQVPDLPSRHPRPPTPHPGLRRSARSRRAPTLTTASQLGQVASNESSSTQAELDALARNRPQQSVEAYAVPSTDAPASLQQPHSLEESLAESPLAYVAASNNDPDLLTWDQCMADEHRDEWLAAAQKEISALEEKGTWVEEDIAQAKTKVLPGTWVGKVKRHPDGTILKRKMRYCVRGDLDERQDVETHSKVVAWSSIRIFLILSLVLRWYTCSCDFSNAFVQADLPEPMWIHPPRGFKGTNPDHNRTVLRLVKSLYGISAAPRLYWLYMTDILTGPELNFVQSTHDPCVYYKEGIMLVLWVDDLICSAKSKQVADEFFETLRKLKMEFTQEDSITSYLGIKFEEDTKNGSFTLTQPGLIGKIIEATNMKESRTNAVPAVREALGKDPDGAPFRGPWNYRSIVGMLLYLSTNTRPDITYAVSQVCRFSHDPKESHATAVKTLIRYLNGTPVLGTIMKPTKSMDLEAYCDADFAGLYGRDPDSEETSAKSRMGYIIKLAGCPLVWKSQLISEITLSTAESEYAALSSCMRVLIPIRRLLAELIPGIGVNLGTTTTIKAKVFEDNNSALQLAVQQCITNRTRHYLVKWHHFWSCVKPREGLPEIEVVRVDTEFQDADFFTKGLVKEPFLANRRRVMGN